MFFSISALLEDTDLNSPNSQFPQDGHQQSILETCPEGYFIDFYWDGNAYVTYPCPYSQDKSFYDSPVNFDWLKGTLKEKIAIMELQSKDDSLLTTQQAIDSLTKHLNNISDSDDID